MYALLQLYYSELRKVLQYVCSVSAPIVNKCCALALHRRLNGNQAHTTRIENIFIQPNIDREGGGKHHFSALTVISKQTMFSNLCAHHVSNWFARANTYLLKR